MVLVTHQSEIVGFDTLKPFRLETSGLGHAGNSIRNLQPWQRMRFASELLFEHRQMVFVDMRVANEIAEPARLVTSQTGREFEQQGSFGEIERRAEPNIVAADVKAKRQLTRRRVGDELVQQVIL